MLFPAITGPWRTFAGEKGVYMKRCFETLEERRLLAVTAGGEFLTAPSVLGTAGEIIVDTLEDAVDPDDGVISLREAIDMAAPGDSIRFAQELAGGTILLTQGQIYFYNPVSVDASDLEGGITIDGNYQDGIFLVIEGTADQPVSLTGLTMINGYGFAGGAVGSYGYCNLTDCVISNCFSYNGGGIASYGSGMTLTRVTLTGNCVDEYGQGGAILTANGTVTITDSVMTENRAANGGALMADSGTVTVLRSVITDNTAESYGGAVQNTSANLTIADSLIAQNSAEWGGSGVTINNGSVDLRGCTLTANAGEGILQWGGVLTVENSILVGNQGDDFSAQGEMDCYASNTLTSFTEWTGSDTLFLYDASKPLFTDADTGDYTLSANSQALDRANPAFLVSITDLAGNDRVYSGTADLGAYERTDGLPAALLLVDCDTWFYDGTPHGVTFTGLRGGDILTYSEDGVTWSSEPVTRTELGVTPFWVHVEREGYSDWGFQVSVKVKEVPALTVTILYDLVDSYDGEYSLREAIAYADDGAEILFATELAGGTITLSGEPLVFDYGVNIDGWFGGKRITLNGNGASSVLYLTPEKFTSDIVLSGLVITGGNAEMGGGIYVGAYRNLKLSNSILTGNTSSNAGGGIASYDGYVTLDNVLIAGNESASGGGIFNWCGSMSIYNCTIAGNQSTDGFYYEGGGGGIVDSYGTFYMYNSIVVQNVGPDGTSDFVSDWGYDNAWNVLTTFDEWTESESVILYDPASPLFVDAASGNYRLAEGTAAVDAGNNDYASVKTDLDGTRRISGGIVDLGAYEYLYSQPETILPPHVITGNPNGPFAAAGGNRQQITWNTAPGAVSYEFAWLDNGIWRAVTTEETSALVSGLACGSTESYRVRALGNGITDLDSEWGEIAEFLVCPVDINGDSAIDDEDEFQMACSWLSDEEDWDWNSACDIDGDGEITPRDRAYLIANYLKNTETDTIIYPHF